MEPIRFIKDEEIEIPFQVPSENGELETLSINALEALLIYDNCEKGQPLYVRYRAFSKALEEKFKKKIPYISAYFIVGKAVEATSSLKKNILGEPSLNSSESAQTA